MATLIFTYSRKPDVSADEFKRFIIEKDQPATFLYPCVKSARIFEVQDSNAAFEYLETLDVTSFEDWDRETKNPPDKVKQVLQEWGSFGKVEELKIYRTVEFFSKKRD